MTFAIGMPRPAGAGRKPGTPNRATATAQRVAVHVPLDDVALGFRFPGNEDSKTFKLGIEHKALLSSGIWGAGGDPRLSW
jgi:hypothetical protein